MAAPLGRDSLPGRWSYGVCRDGRVFFIDDDTQTTTWLHPRSGDPVNSGHMIRSDLPRGWEEGFTVEGVSFFINHNQRSSTFLHPLTGLTSARSADFVLHDPSQGGCMMSSTTVSEASTTVTSSTVDSASKGSRSSSGRLHSFGKRQQSVRRSPNAAVVVRGWLHKQDSSGMRLWKRKWFVLADFCLFYYKDSREETVLGSIPLPSYVVSAVGADDHISRKFAFKASHAGMRWFTDEQSSVIGSQAEHPGMRTYYFSADTQEDMNTWLRAMSKAAVMQSSNEAPTRPLDTLGVLPQLAVPQTNHVSADIISTPVLGGSRTLVHEVLLEPIQQDGSPAMFDQAGTVLEMDTHASLPASSTPSAFPQADALSASAPVSRAPSRAPSRGASTLPSGVCSRNGAGSTPSPILEPNGIAAGTYQRGPTLPPADRQLKRRSALDQVEQWIQVQKGDNTLPRRTPPTQHKPGGVEAFRTLPRTPGHSPPPGRRGEYRYAQDRLSHFRLTPEQGHAPASSTALQLYEWQQRHQFRHGSPTAPLYTPAPDYPYGPRPPSAVPPSLSAPRPERQPRCVSVPPSSADVPPPGSRGSSPTRRPHTPAERLTVRPGGEPPPTLSPRRSQSQLLKAATLDRRSTLSGYITHTVSAPSLHGKTADDTYLQLKKDLEHLDLKVAAGQVQKEAAKPVRVAESDVDVKLSRLCEQDKTLKELEVRISSLKEDKDKLERVLDLSRQQMEQYRDQPGHSQKIAYQQRLLQEDLVAIRAQISRVCTEMTLAWDEYGSLERSVEQLRAALQAQMSNSALCQKSELKRELWRIEDVLAGLSASKANFKITVDSVQNPERKFVPLTSDLTVPSQKVEAPPPPRSSHFLAAPTSSDDEAPPRPPLPRCYDYGDLPPEVPPLPKEASVIRHTSVRGLKRQSDERRRDRESGQYVANGDAKSDLRSYLSEPELPGTSVHDPDAEYQHFQGKGSSSGQHQSTSVSSYVTLRRGPGSSASRERPHSALELQFSSGEGLQPRGRMTAEEQLERMKRHQRALVRERQRNLSLGEHSCLSSSTSQRSSSSSRLPSSTSDPPAAVFDWPEPLEWAEGRSEEGWTDAKGWGQPNSPPAGPRETDLEPVEYDLDISRELSTPQKVPIPERYIESDSEEPPSPEELAERWARAQRIRNLLARSSVQNLRPSAALDFSELDSALQQQERIMNVSQVLASEASRRSKLVAAKAAAEH